MHPKRPPRQESGRLLFKTLLLRRSILVRRIRFAANPAAALRVNHNLICIVLIQSLQVRRSELVVPRAPRDDENWWLTIGGDVLPLTPRMQ